MQSILSLHVNHQVAIHEKLQPFTSSIRVVNRDHNKQWTIDKRHQELGSQPRQTPQG